MSSGCVVFLIDESASMQSPIAESTKTKAEVAATSLNALLKQLAAGGADIDVSIVGYRGESATGANVGARWSGDLVGRQFVAVQELSDFPLTVEERIRRIPDASGVGTNEEKIKFPVWYSPQTGGDSAQVAAFEHCESTLTGWLSEARDDARPPLIINVTSGPASDGNPTTVIQRLQSFALRSGPPLVLQAHLASSVNVESQEERKKRAVPQATLYPSNRVYLPVGLIRDLFERCSLLPDSLVSALRNDGIVVQNGARGMIFNARMVDLIKLFGLVKTYAQTPIMELAAPAPSVVPEPRRQPSPADAQILRAPPPPPGRVPTAPATAMAGTAVVGSGTESKEDDSTSSSELQTIPESESTVDSVTELDEVREPDETSPTEDAKASVSAQGEDSTSQEFFTEQPTAHDTGGPPADTATLSEDVASATGVDEEWPLEEDVDTPDQPARQLGSAESDCITALVLAIDRSVSQPSAPSAKNVCKVLQDAANELLGEVAKLSSCQLQVAVMSYGLDTGGETEISTTFGDALGERIFATPADLADHPLRIEDVHTEISDGAGGLVPFRQQRPVFIELEPTGIGDVSKAFQTLVGIANEWCDGQGEKAKRVVVLHLTRGVHDADAINGVTEQLRRLRTDYLLYHVIATESPFRSLAYPDSPDGIDSAEMRRLWQITSILEGRDRFAKERSYISEMSRGFVVNGKFDLLLASLSGVTA